MAHLKYEIELWKGNGIQVADVGHLAQGISFSMERNEAEEVGFSLDMQSFEGYCQRIGEYPRNILEPYVTDIKIRRKGTYLLGAQVQSLQPAGDDKSTKVNSVKASGYLNLLKDLYISKTYGVETTPSSWVDAAQIARDVLATAQTKQRGNYGIILGTNQFNTGVGRYRAYIDQNAKEAIVNLTNLENGKFDFSFSYDRKFQTWQWLGDDRPDVSLTYPGNIKSIDADRSALTLYNAVTGIGSVPEGSPTDTPPIKSYAEDLTSQLTYGRREKVVSFSSVKEQATLDQNTKAYLLEHKDIIQLPDITVDGSSVDLLDVMAGNRVMVRVENHPFMDNINGQYRIEKTSVSLDKNYSETITLTFDE